MTSNHFQEKGHTTYNMLQYEESSWSSQREGPYLDTDYTSSGGPSHEPPPYEDSEPFHGGMTGSHVQISRNATLHKLIAIPATSAALGSAFLRAYPLALWEFGIPPEVFLDFLDRVNRAAVASPPVEVLGLAGDIVGMVPLQTAQLVGTVLSTTALATKVAMSKGRVEMLLRQANKELFRPRGLQVSVAKLEAVAKLAGMPFLDNRGKLNKRAAVLAPLEDEDSEDEIQNVRIQRRRLAALDPWISPLEVRDLPQLAVPDTVFGKMHAAASERKRNRAERSMDKKRQKMKTDREEDTQKAREKYNEEMAKLAEKEDKLSRKQKGRMDRDMEKIQREKEEVKRDYERELEKIERHRQKKDGEEKMMRKILFLTIQQVAT